MTAKIAIVADDLTGAGDTAVQFVRVGWRTQLSMAGARGALDDPATAGADVLAVTSHSRALPGGEAARVVGAEVALLRAAGVRRLYKKVDSTLRGPFRAEIEAARAAWADDAIAVVCPAFPATGRTVEQGVLMVDGTPVTETSAARDPVTPVGQGHIPTLLDCPHVIPQAGETAEALARRLAQAGPVVSVDARSDEDLVRLALAIAELGERAVPVGAGGLAAPLARVWAGEETRGAIVVVVTSQHSAARGQARRLQEQGARVWCPTLEALADPAGWAAWSAQVLEAERTGAQDGQVVLVLAPEGRRDDLGSDAVAQRLGGLGADLVRTGRVAGVVATGGDGASQVLQSLGATGIALVDEVTGGVPLGTLTGGASAGLPVVTKAGGFGAEDVLVRAAQAIRERRFAS
ncbi:MAG: four-carbon acid sugar kinase family protein [Dethiobacter sp.]|nr:four-carbon acid sugar kinase family protein [Dethiobacter sp.]